MFVIKKRSHQITTNEISKEEAWSFLTDLKNWPQMHSDLEYVTAPKIFAKGEKFQLKPKGAPLVQCALTEVVPGQAFTDVSYLLGSKMFITHSLIENESGLTIKTDMLMTGVFTLFWYLIVGKKVADDFDDEAKSLIRWIIGKRKTS